MEGGKRLVRGNCEEERWPVSKLAGLSKTTHMAFSAVRRPSCVGVVPLMVFVVDQKPDQGVKPLVTELSSPNAPRFLEMGTCEANRTDGDRVGGIGCRVGRERAQVGHGGKQAKLRRQRAK